MSEGPEEEREVEEEAGLLDDKAFVCRSYLCKRVSWHLPNLELTTSGCSSRSL